MKQSKISAKVSNDITVSQVQSNIDLRSDKTRQSSQSLIQAIVSACKFIKSNNGTTTTHTQSSRTLLRGAQMVTNRSYNRCQVYLSSEKEFNCESGCVDAADLLLRDDDVPWE